MDNFDELAKAREKRAAAAWLEAERYDAMAEPELPVPTPGQKRLAWLSLAVVFALGVVIGLLL